MHTGDWELVTHETWAQKETHAVYFLNIFVGELSANVWRKIGNSISREHNTETLLGYR